jgi:hypothetical protein
VVLVKQLHELLINRDKLSLKFEQIFLIHE